MWVVYALCEEVSGDHDNLSALGFGLKGDMSRLQGNDRHHCIYAIGSVIAQSSRKSGLFVMR